MPNISTWMGICANAQKQCDHKAGPTVYHPLAPTSHGFLLVFTASRMQHNTIIKSN